MKTILFSAAFLLLAFMACKKEESTTPCQDLEGIWNCVSWQEDAEQFFGDTAFISSAVLDFKAYNPEEGQGDVEWSIAYTIGGPVTIIGYYTLNEQCDEVTITPKGGVGTTYQFAISGSELTLESNTNNVEVMMAFNRQ